MKGSVKQDKKTKTWFFVVDVGVDPATGKRRQIRRRRQGPGQPAFKTRKAAEDALKTVFAVEAADGNYVEPSAQPVRVYLEKWLAGVAANRKPSTVSMYRHKLRRYVTPKIGALPLRAVDAATLDALYAELLLHGGQDDGPLSAQTVGVIHRILHRALGDAARRRTIRNNPATDAVVPRASSVPRERDAWSSDQLRTFLEHVADDRLYALWAVAATTGARRGELCGMKWADVNLDAAQWVVRRSRVPIIGGVVESTPKSDRTRVIALAPATVAALRTHRRKQLEERLVWGEAWTDTGYVFTKEDGNPLRPDAVTRAFNAHVATSGLPKIVLHGVRHSVITAGLAAGVPIHVMQAQAGHANVQTTLGYTHVSDSAAEDAAATIERLILGGS